MTSPLALRDLSRGYRKTLVMVLIVSGVGLVVSSLLGYLVAGLMFCVGLAVGLVNNRLMIASTARFSATDGTNPRRLMFSTFQRLAGITAIVVIFAFVFRPEGVVVVVGLAVSQLLVLATAGASILGEVRKG